MTSLLPSPVEEPSISGSAVRVVAGVPVSEVDPPGTDEVVGKAIEGA